MKLNVEKHLLDSFKQFCQKQNDIHYKDYKSYKDTLENIEFRRYHLRKCHAYGDILNQISDLKKEKEKY